jgi:flagellar protein FlaI
LASVDQCWNDSEEAVKMVQTENQTGTKEGVGEQTVKVEPEIKKPKKRKSEKKEKKSSNVNEAKALEKSDLTVSMKEQVPTNKNEDTEVKEPDVKPGLNEDEHKEKTASEPESKPEENIPGNDTENGSVKAPPENGTEERNELSKTEGTVEESETSDKKTEPVPKMPEPVLKDAELAPENKIKVKKGKQGKKEEKTTGDGKNQPEGIESLMQRFDGDTTRDIIKEQMTPEKQAVYEILEDKLVSDIETRIKKLKDMQGLEEKQPQTLIEKMKIFLTKEEAEKETYDPAVDGPLVTFEGISGYNELERYWVNEPYAFVVILFNPEKNSNLYYVAEPKLSDFEELFLKEIKDRLKDVLLFEAVKSDEDKNKILTAKVRKLVKDYAIDITPLTIEKILYYTRRDFIHFGKIDPLMHDDRIEDVSANGFDVPIYLYHKKYTNLATNVIYKEEELDSYVIRLAQRCGKHISVAEPMIDATMPDGSRIQMTLGTVVTTHGATFTIRKFSEVPITPVDLINWNTFSAEEMAYLWLCIENNKSLIYAGGTASGKTSSLNAVSLFIPWQAKIITLEDTRELKLPHPNWIPGVTRDSFTPDGKGSIDMYDLLRAALRQRPEYLLVGEVRGKEALTLFQAMSTGHTTFSTMHADSVSSAIHRLENPPISVPRTMIQALNIISIQSQTFVRGKRARRNMKLVEITDIDPTTRNIRTNDIFVWDALTDKFNRVGESKALAEIMIRRGWNIADLKKELNFRQKILEFMVNNKINDFNAIATIIHDYQVTPDKVLKKLNITG